jgi:UDP-galactopyranose mutase
MIDFLVIGAGISGATFAYLAKMRGYSVTVVEKRQELGGMCATEDINGIMVHKYGAHIFKTDDRGVWELVNGLMEFVPFVNTPKARHNGRIYSLPVNMNTFNELWGVSTPDEAKGKIMSQKRHYDKIENLEQYLLSEVGSDVYETIFKDYTQKQWGKPCS